MILFALFTATRPALIDNGTFTEEQTYTNCAEGMQVIVDFLLGNQLYFNCAIDEP